jgi:uncharacterized membrane protein (DUF4010 family)
MPTTITPPLWTSAVGFLVALGIGLLVGAERERRKRDQAGRGVAGIRTYTAAALAGAVSMQVGGPLLLSATTVVVGALVTVSYWASRDDQDPGLTTEVALILTVLLGALAIESSTVAAMAGVATAILLAARTPLHRFVSSVLTEREVWDALMLAAATLIVLPLLPGRALDPYGVLNPRSIWLLIILVLSVSAAGYVAARLVGSRFGLPLAGLLGGFVSSTATIGAMGARARRNPPEIAAAAAAAVLSTVATMIQLALLLAASSPPTLRAAAPSLLAAVAIALVFGVGSTLQALRRPAADEERRSGAFSLKAALLFAATVTAVLMISAAAQAHLGGSGLFAAAALSGAVDAHAAAISVGELVAGGLVDPSAALIPILVAVSTNTVSKLVMAGVSGGRSFLLRVGPGLVLVALASWAPLAWSSFR